MPFSLIGPKLSGLAIDAIELGEGKVNFPVVFKYAILMIIFYVFFRNFLIYFINYYVKNE